MPKRTSPVHPYGSYGDTAVASLNGTGRLEGSAAPNLARSVACRMPMCGAGSCPDLGDWISGRGNLRLANTGTDGIARGRSALVFVFSSTSALVLVYPDADELLFVSMMSLCCARLPMWSHLDAERVAIVGELHLGSCLRCDRPSPMPRCQGFMLAPCEAHMFARIHRCQSAWRNLLVAWAEAGMPSQSSATARTVLLASALPPRVCQPSTRRPLSYQYPLQCPAKS